MNLQDSFLQPFAITNDIVTQTTNQEILIYNVKTNRAMCLNETLTVIWQLCDGKRNLSDISFEASKKLKTSVTDEVIWLALDELDKNNLLVKSELKPISNLSQVSRREIIRKIGLTTAVAIPLITGIIAPKAIHAQSGGGGTCPSGSCCCDIVCTAFGAFPTDTVCTPTAVCGNTPAIQTYCQNNYGQTAISSASCRASTNC